MEDPNDRASQTTISVIVDRNVLPGKAKEFEEHVENIIEASSRFPRHIGTDVINPDRENRYIEVFRFASKNNLRLRAHHKKELTGSIKSIKLLKNLPS